MTNINFNRPGDQVSDPIEIEFEIFEDDDNWEMGKATGKLKDVGWLAHNVDMIGPVEALECDEIPKTLAPGKYKAVIRMVGHWYHGDSGSDYEDGIECISITKV